MPQVLRPCPALLGAVAVCLCACMHSIQLLLSCGSFHLRVEMPRCDGLLSCIEQRDGHDGLLDPFQVNYSMILPLDMFENTCSLLPNKDKKTNSLSCGNSVFSLSSLAPTYLGHPGTGSKKVRHSHRTSKVSIIIHSGQ